MDDAHFWNPPPSVLSIVADEVHLWRIPLELPDDHVRWLRHLLTPDELARADRFYFDRDRRRFTIARATLRRILAQYLGLEAAALRFQYGKRGKPELDPGHGRPDLEFNLSHSHELAMLGVTLERVLGVDLEGIRPLDDAQRLGDSTFSAWEASVLREASPEHKLETFFNCWTRKEAYIKAIGEGLAHPLKDFDVSLRIGDEARLLRTRLDPAEAERWELRAVPPGPGYVGAVCVEGKGWGLRGWHWAEPALGG